MIIQPKTEGIVVDTHTSIQHEVHLIGLLHRCEGASLLSGLDRYHVVIEVWDIRNPQRPYRVSIITPSNDTDDDGHYSRLSGTEAVLKAIKELGEDADKLPGEPGDYIRAVIMHDATETLGAILSGALTGLGDDDDDSDTPLPGAFAGFNPFGR